MKDLNEKFRKIVDVVVKNGKYVFPVVVLVAVAVIVVVALRAGGVRREELEQIGETISTVESETPSSEEEKDETVALVENEDPAIFSLIATYYNAVAVGDEETLRQVCDKVEEKDMLRFLETAKYIEYYPTLEIYTKPGFAQGDTVAYVYFKVIFTGKEAEYPGYQMLYISTAEDGSLYIKRSSSSNEVLEYVQRISLEADVVVLTNRVTVEYDNLMAEQPDLLTYLNDLNEEVNRVVGVELAKQEAESNASQDGGAGEDGETEGTDGEDGQPEHTPVPEQVEEVTYATVSTTVNFRGSDSEKAEKLGKVPGGTKVQVLEQLVNGWSRILYDNKEGFIMSKFLKIQESALKYTPIGTVKATDNINVRADASTDSAKMGTLVEGDTADLIADEGEWCKINFSGQIAYVKSEYVRIELN